MITDLYELRLLDKAGSQAEKARAWRHELQLELSTFIASCRINKLTTCHNISKWISGDLESKCIALIASVVLNMAAFHSIWCGHRWSWWKLASQSVVSTKSFATTWIFHFNHTKTACECRHSNELQQNGNGNEVRFHPAFIEWGAVPVFNVSSIQKEGWMD